jgi:hypothetical protein
MTSAARGRLTARRIWLLALAGGALAVGSAGVALGDVPVYDAGTDAQQAADALNSGCVDMAKCDWDQTAATSAYGPWKIVGDKLYNCSATAEALTAQEVHESRSESTSVSEKLSVEISLGFLNLASTSLTASGFSQQEQGSTTTVTSGTSVPVSPGYVGWTESHVMSNVSSGDASITDGIHLMAKVTGIDMTFPAIDKNGQAQAENRTYSRPMTTTQSGSTTPGEVETYCTDVEAQPASAASAARAARPMAATSRVPREKPFKLTVCRTTRASGPSSHRARCYRRSVKGLLPKRHHLRKVTATLERAGRVHARDTDRRGGIRLTQRRDIKAGRYRLVLRKKKKNIVVRNSKGKKLYRATTQEFTIIPITVRWKQKR